MKKAKKKRKGKEKKKTPSASASALPCRRLLVAIAARCRRLHRPPPPCPSSGCGGRVGSGCQGSVSVGVGLSSVIGRHLGRPRTRTVTHCRQSSSPGAAAATASLSLLQGRDQSGDCHTMAVPLTYAPGASESAFEGPRTPVEGGVSVRRRENTPSLTSMTVVT